MSEINYVIICNSTKLNMNSESIQLMKFVAVGEHFLCYFHTVVYYVEQWDRSESMFSVNKPYGSRHMLSFVIY